MAAAFALSEAEPAAAGTDASLRPSPADRGIEPPKPAPHPEGESSHQLRALHGLRFLAAFSILFSHSCDWLANFTNHQTIINLSGGFIGVLGMPMFFVLSGFVIHFNYARLFSTVRPRWAILEFLGARFARIYPLFICFLLVGIAVDGVLQWYYTDKLNLLLVLGHFLTLTQSWVYIVLFGDRTLIYGPFGLSWSLSTEFFFYIAYVVLVLHITRFRRISSLLITAGAMSILAVAAIAFAAGHRAEIETFARLRMGDQFGQFDYSAMRWFFYCSPYVRVLEFILGCLTAQLYGLLAERKATKREAVFGTFLIVGSVVVLLAFAFTYVANPFGPFIAQYSNILMLNFGFAVPVAVLIFCVSRYKSSAVAAFLSAPLMVLLGELSYSIYTVHTWTLRIFERPGMKFVSGAEWEAALRIALAIALTLILSTATYRLIEVPARAWVRGAVGRRLVKSFGPREANRLTVNYQFSTCRAMLVAGPFVLMIAAVLAYQFIIVPDFAAYTR
jgi:peptidoglycan/LPS O-acetylase OafA/YrhL